MTDLSIAVLVPVLNRPHRVQLLMDSFSLSIRKSEAALCFIASPDDYLEVQALRAAGASYIFSEHISWASKINAGYRHTHDPWMLLGADDLRFQSGWIDVVRPILESGAHGVVGTNDLGNAGTIDGLHSTHPLISRAYADKFGTWDGPGAICHEGYAHNYVDNEIVQTAKQRGQWAHCKDCIVEHLHPAWGKSVHDSTYALGQSKMMQDRVTFMERLERFLR